MDQLTTGIVSRPFLPLRRGVPGDSDERLARAVATGNEQAFAELYERYRQPLYRYCRSLVRDDVDAQDVLQSAFTSALVALRADQRRAPVRPWLYRIVHNEAISHLRRRRPAEEDPSDLSLAGHGDSAEDQMLARDRFEQLIADLARLPERHRAALVMRELSGLSHEEIATALATSTAAAKQAVFEARRGLHELAEGRAMDCDAVQRLISEGDGRSLRGRRVRAHMNDCPSCEAFAASIASRTAELRAVVPVLPMAAATAIFARVLAGAGAHAGSALAGGAAAGAGSVAATTASGGHGAGAAGAGLASAGSGAGAVSLTAGAKVILTTGLTKLFAAVAVVATLATGAVVVRHAVEHHVGSAHRSATPTARAGRAQAAAAAAALGSNAGRVAAAQRASGSASPAAAASAGPHGTTAVAVRRPAHPSSARAGGARASAVATLRGATPAAAGGGRAGGDGGATGGSDSGGNPAERPSSTDGAGAGAGGDGTGRSSTGGDGTGRSSGGDGMGRSSGGDVTPGSGDGNGNGNGRGDVNGVGSPPIPTGAATQSTSGGGVVRSPGSGDSAASHGHGDGAPDVRAPDASVAGSQ